MRAASLARLLLPLAALVAAFTAWASYGGEAPAVTADEPAPHRHVVAYVARDAPSAALSLSTDTPFQGGAIRIAVSNASAGTASAFGRTYALSPDGFGGLAGFVGIDADDPPGPAPLIVSVAGSTGRQETMERTITVQATNWTVDHIWLPPGPTPTPPPPGAPTPPPPPPDDNQILPVVYAGMTPRQWTDTWLLPLAEPNLRSCLVVTSFEVACVSGYFGEQRSFNGGPVQGHHTGTDLAANTGTPIMAMNDGKVVLSGLYRVRGNLVVIDHGGGIFSSYAHLSQIGVSVGETVEQGEIIGKVGSTGLSTGPHLHWELVVSGIRVDALRWLDGTQGF